MRPSHKSLACKQKGFSDKKNGIGETTLQDQEIKKDPEEKRSGKQFVIYFPEYQEYQKKHPNNLVEFPLFCFFRKNWIGKFDVEKFHTYIEIFLDDFWDNMHTGTISPARKKYNEFQEKFFGGDDFIVDFNGKGQ